MLLSWKNSCDGAYSSLDVRFTKACDNACSFCIEKKGIDSLGNTDVSALVASTLSSGIKEVLILGGEPLLNPKAVYQYILCIRDKVDKIYLTTSLPNTFNTHKITIYKILDLLDGLNVSLQHYNSRKNNALLAASHRHNRIKILETLNKHYASKIRTSINLTKGGIDNKKSLLLCLRMLAFIGCEHVKINELQNSDLFVSYEEIMGVKLPPAYACGCQTTIKVKEARREWGIHTPSKITLKRSCFKVADVEASWRDVLKAFLNRWHKTNNKFRVLYEDGTLKGGWLEKGQEEKA